MRPGSDAVSVEALVTAGGSSPQDIHDTVITLCMSGHLRLTKVTLLDITDSHNELVFEDEWLLHPADSGLSLTGNLFTVEDVLTGEGIILLKEAPLPYARPLPTPVDLKVELLKAETDGPAWKLALFGTGIGGGVAEGYAHSIIPYIGGRDGMTAALQAYQNAIRPYKAGRDGLFLTNTWGDRSRDARINEEFILQEVCAGSELGADIVQIDDGWEKGRTANSSQPSGIWEGFWSADQEFWQPDPVRFPNGLLPVTAALSERGMALGLWFAPDSSDDFANWERDADALLAINLEHGVHHFKIDSVSAKTRLGEVNLHRFFDRVLEGCRDIVFDLDVTADVRPGYFGMMHAGPLFVENRYTD